MLMEFLSHKSWKSYNIILYGIIVDTTIYIIFVS